MQKPHSGNDKRTRHPRRTLARLFRDNAGNTMAIVGAALIPITAMIGSGLDMSRAYMAKSRLQSACDAASLAARRVMKNDELSATVTQTGQDFFDFNFPQGLYETEEFEPDITKPETGLVRIAAETRMPTTVMKLFGFSTLPLEVNCEASLNFVNTDVVLVLDVTGSMKESLGGMPKIDALQDAVMALYDELAPVQTQLQSQGLRLRYGIVPYSSSVNVGRLLYAEDENYITSLTPYQSREAFMNKPSNKRYALTSWRYKELSLDTSDFKKPSGEIKLALTAGKLNANGTISDGTVATGNKSYNLKDLASSGTGMDITTVKWNGCIEERKTVPSITAASGFNVPIDAYDLNINHIPDSDDTRWRPMLREAVYQRKAGNATQTSGTALNKDNEAYWACPNEATRLQEWDRTDLDDEVQKLKPVGGTYHDVGMIWGARFISTGGVFGDGCEEYNGMPCNRHVIFMTDDQQTAYCSDTYTAYGLEQNDMRVSGAGSCPQLLARHQKRFQMICNATKNMDVSVWVVAFGTSLNASLTSCASNSSQAKTSTNSTQLITQFREIGNQIGALRLTK